MNRGSMSSTYVDGYHPTATAFCSPTIKRWWPAQLAATVHDASRSVVDESHGSSHCQLIRTFYSDALLCSTVKCSCNFLFVYRFETHTHTTVLRPYVLVYPGELVPEVTFIHSHPSCSSTILISFLHLP